ncbi:MAG: bacillithiol biosynthesis cysteine-adding enzyme BshC [Ekhidna sp.]
MRTETLPLDETDCFSRLFIDYIQQKPELKKFYTDFPAIENFRKIIEERNFNDANRSTLSKALQSQYEGLEISPAVSQNIERLKDNKTFTITTGHQLNIFTGPLYFIYKIVTVVNACKALKKEYPEYEFVPVYWMASEDHDFEEIDHFHFENRKYQWKTEQTGAVGRFDPTGLLDIVKELPKGAEIFKEAYSENTLADAARHYVNTLFGAEGIVVVDADDAALKSIFAPVIQDDLFTHSAEKLVAKDSQELESLGYKTQVHAREINFFYLEGDVRERIEKEGDSYKVVDTTIEFSADEIKRLIKDHPERFSPNVILRPLYQETILPNLAYVGGPSEAVYWLQLKSVFEHFNTAFPLLMPRNFALVIESHVNEKWEKTNLTSTDLFLGADQAFAKWVKNNSDKELSYTEELTALKKTTESLSSKAKKVDPTLVQHLDALHVIFGKKIEKAEKKLLRAEKRNHSEKEDQIQSVKDSLFPNGSLQERRDNFLNFFLSDPLFLQKLLDRFDAFNYKMYLLHKEE